MAASLVFHPPVIAHRGACAVAPENTLASFKAAQEQGAVWIETDVKLTHDGVPILMHDKKLNRTTNGRGNVADTNWDEIEKLDAGSWFDASFAGERVPRLTEALRFILDHNLRINLEIKPCPGRARSTTMVTLIETAKLWPLDYPPPLISSFDIEALTIAAQLHPEWPRGLLLDGWTDEWPALMAQTQASAIHPDARDLTPKRLAALRQADFPVLAHTVKNVKQARELLQAGVTGIFWDNPTEIIGNL